MILSVKYLQFKMMVRSDVIEEKQTDLLIGISSILFNLYFSVSQMEKKHVFALYYHS